MTTSISDSWDSYKNNKSDDYKDKLLHLFDGIRGSINNSSACPMECKISFTSAFDLARHISTEHFNKLSTIFKTATGNPLTKPRKADDFKRFERWLTFWVLDSYKTTQQKEKTKLPESTTDVKLVIPNTIQSIVEVESTKPNIIDSITPEKTNVTYISDFLKRKGPSDFSKLSEELRNSIPISKTWKGRIWNYYHNKHNGLVKCYGCHEAEATQIHHASQPFHEIILRTLREQGTTAEIIMNHFHEDKLELYNKLLKKIDTIHRKLKVEDCIPFCEVCNQTVEIRRKRLAAAKEEFERNSKK